MVPYRIWIHTGEERRVNKISCRRERAVKGLVFFRPTGYDFDASRVTCSDHVPVLGSIAAFGGEDIRDGLIIRPPFETLDMFLRRAH
jgi:hypothetical protein